MTKDVVDVAIKKKATKHLNPVCGNWPTVRLNIVAENAQGVDEHVVSGHAITNDAGSRSRVKSSVLLLPNEASVFMGHPACAIHAWSDERKKYPICAGKVLSKLRKGSDVSRAFSEAAQISFALIGGRRCEERSHGAQGHAWCPSRFSQ